MSNAIDLRLNTGVFMFSANADVLAPADIEGRLSWIIKS